MRKRSFDRLIRLLIGSLVLSGLAFGQGGGDSSKGSVAVEVHDASSAVIPNATVILSGPGAEKKASTDGRGEAVFYGLAPETYSVRVELKGFRTAEVSKINVTASQRSPVSVTLQTGGVTETIQVSESTQPVDTTSSGTGTTITSDQFTNLPVARNVMSLFSLAPGASPGMGTDNYNTPRESFNPSISGSSGLENQYVIDGINTTDQGYGSFGVWSINYGSMGSGVNFDFVKEIQIKTGGFEAQYGQVLGGVLNIVTDSGGNKFHGAAYVYSGPSWAEGDYTSVNSKYGRTSQPFTDKTGRFSTDFGFNLGGPLKKDKLFWYGGFNPSFNTVSRLAPTGFAARANGPQNWDTHSINWVGKLDYNINDRHRIEGTAFGDPSHDTTGVHGTLLRDDLLANSAADYGTRNWAVKYDGAFAARSLLTASFAWNHAAFEETANNPALVQAIDYTKPKAGVSAFTVTGGLGNIENNITNNKQYNTMFTQNANFLGSHQLDFGFGYNDIDYSEFHDYTGGTFNTPNVAAFAPYANVPQYGAVYYIYPTSGTGSTSASRRYAASGPVVYQVHRGNVSDPNIATAGNYQDAFAQDAWQINRFLTIKAGVRWERQQIHGESERYVFSGNWAPRFGVIVDPTGHRKTKIFGNWGRYFEKIPQDISVRALTSEVAYRWYFAPPGPATTANYLGGIQPTGADPTIVAGGTKAEYEEEIVAGIEHELPHGVVISGRFIHRDLKRIVEDISGITVEQALAGAGQQYVISNPSASLDLFHNATECTSGPNCDTSSGYTLDSGQLGADGKVDGFPDPRRVYNAMEITAEKRFGNKWSMLANYRLSKLFGNIEGNFRNDNTQSDPNISSLFDFANSPALADQFKVGVLPTDRRNTFNVYGSYMFLRGLTVGFGFQSISGGPLSKLLAHPAYGNTGEIPAGGRGAYGRAPWQNYVDTHISYKLPLHNEKFRANLTADVFNIFNRQTPVLIDQNFQLAGGVTNNDFLKPTTLHRPIYARMSVRFDF